MEDIFVASEGLHFHMLADVFFTDVIRTPNYTLALHDKADDYYSNLAGELACASEEVPEVLRQIEARCSQAKRKATLYVTPFSKPAAELSAALRNGGFRIAYRDAWMYMRSDPVIPVLPEKVTVEAVRDAHGMRLFVETFNRAYSGTDPREPYGQAPPEWGETLYSSFFSGSAGRRLEYLLLFHDTTAAAVLLTSSIGKFTGIYSIGTIPKMRGRGYASALTLYAARRLKDQGQEVIFLQTEKDSYNERFYEKLGFATEWVAHAWCRLA